MRTHTDSKRSPVAAALRYVSWGWQVLPLHTPASAGCSCADPDCTSAGKHPRTIHGVHDASRQPKQVRDWWARWPDANVGIVTGALVVIDVDGDLGHHSLTALQARLGQSLPATPWVETARGRHLYFHALGIDIGNSAGRLGPGLDVRGQRGYAVAPPSRHANGHTYRWHGIRDGIALLPPWLAEELTRPKPTRPPVATPVMTPDAYVQAALSGELERIAAAPTGARNNTLNRAAFRLGQLAGGRLCDAGSFEAPLLDAALAAGLGEGEATKTIVSGLLAGLRSPRFAR